MYGILEGAVAYQDRGDVFHPSAWTLLGQVGVLGQLFGAVDFGIVKAAVTITIEIGMPFQYIRLPGGCWKISVPAVEADVRADADVEIGSIHVFGHTISITIHFSFSLHLRVDLPFSLKSADCDKAAFALALAAPAAASADVPITWIEDNFNDLYKVLT